MAVDYFLKIDGVSGESPDAKHKGEIQLESFSWGETSPGGAGSGGGGGAGKVHMQDLVVTMVVSKASPKLMLACATGKHHKEAVLTARKAGKSQQEFLVFKFKDVVVTSYQIGGSELSEAPMDQALRSASRRSRWSTSLRRRMARSMRLSRQAGISSRTKRSEAATQRRELGSRARTAV